MTRRRSRPDGIRNSYVEDSGRTYRICRHYGRVILVALKGKKYERILNVDGRRARNLVKTWEGK